MLSNIFIIIIFLSKFAYSQTSTDLTITPTPTTNKIFINCTLDEPLVIYFNETNTKDNEIVLTNDGYCNWILNFEELLSGENPYIINIKPYIFANTLIYACDSGNILMNCTYSSMCAFDDPLYIQEPLVCVNYTPYSYMNSYDTYQITFSLVNVSLDDKKISELNKTTPLMYYTINMIDDVFAYYQYRTVTADYGTLEFYIMDSSSSIQDNPNNVYYIYDSIYLTNFMGSYAYNRTSKNIQPFTSKTGSITVFITVTDNSNLNPNIITQLVYRIKENFTENCNGTSDIIYLGDSIKKNLTTLNNGSCYLSILLPIFYNSLLVNPDYDLTKIPSMSIKSISYKGNSSVSISNNFYKKRILLEISEEITNYWENVIIYGYGSLDPDDNFNIILFKIPPNGELEIDLQFRDASSNIPQIFNTSLYGIFMLPPLATDSDPRWSVTETISCTSGAAEFNIMFVDVALTVYEQLSISNGSSTKSFTNETLSGRMKFYGTILTLNISGDKNSIDDDFANDFLVHYEASHIDETSPPTPRKNYTLIISLSVGTGVVLAILSAIALIFYHLKVKKRVKRYDQMFDLLREMQISEEEIVAFQEKTDEFFIKSDRLFINYDNNLGHGSCSTVYKGHLAGPSPLHIKSGLIETQKYSDCDVAVKVARNFGSGEVEQLYREIQSMKILGYHENIMSLLGWSMPGDAPCLVFDIAKMDLLQLLRDLRNKANEEFPFKDFISILWQIVRGMQYIASNGLIHRDLAARNILLCGSNTAKISDFGLCCKCDETFTYRATISKKLPIRWLALESLTDHIFSEKSDVWAFGVLMYEMFNFGQIPYADLNYNELLEFLKSSQRLQKPVDMAEELYEVARKCWDEDVQNRPNFTELERVFHEMLENEGEGYELLTS